ncbi:MAG: DNA repair exonuclease [Candidatus ainarchaeum sp.]|jgi:DNA repair exonuclease SbcCD nuclease subunit|nr:DNA repair exonuclease [Candidatus ainarchaeum sp.]
MKIAIFSDWHLGLNFGTDLEMDSFVQLSEAFMQIKEENIDFIITCGDLFDKTIPTHEVYYEAISVLNNVDIENKINLKSRQERKLKIPMIGIIGNHEFRGKDFKSTVELLEVMNFLRVVHADSVTIEKEEEKVNVFGLSGVPDRFAKDILDKWNPTPKEGYNILLLHQSFKEYLPFESEEMLSLSNLPKGFDIIANGHLHWKVIEPLDEKTRFIMSGSTVSTQNKKIESDTEKGFFILDTKTNQLDFHAIKNTRKVFYKDLDLKLTTPEKTIEIITLEIEKLIEKKEDKKPLLRIRLKGELLKGYFLKSINLKEIEDKYKDYFYISFSNKIQEQKLKESVEKLKSIEQNKGNLFEISKSIFFEQISQTNISKDFDYQRFFDILYNGDLSKAKEFILDKN